LYEEGADWESKYERMVGESSCEDAGKESIVDEALEAMEQEENEVNSNQGDAGEEWEDATPAEEVDEWEDAAEEEEHLDLLALVEQSKENLQSAEKPGDSASRSTPKLTKKRKRGETTKNITKTMSPKKKRKSTSSTTTKRKSKEQLKREIETWKTTISILIARYRMLVDKMHDDEMMALLLSLSEDLPSPQDSIKDITKWINKHRDTTVRNVRESLEIQQCDEKEFLLLFLYALLQFLKVETRSRLVVKLDPHPYNEYQKEQQSRVRQRRSGGRPFSPLFGQPAGTVKTSAVIYIDCEEEPKPKEPPKKKKKTNSGKGKESSAKPLTPYPVENLNLQVYVDNEWKLTKILGSGQISTTLKSIKPLSQKLEFPIFALGMYSDFSVNLTTSELDINPVKDTVSVQNNFNTITKWFRESQWCKKDFSDLEDKVLAKMLDEEQKELNKIFLEKRTKLPKSQSAYRNHPVYILDKFITRYQAIYPKDTQPSGHCREHAVYKRENLVELHTKDKWLSEQLREVLPEEMEKPYKIIKSNSASKKGMTHLFGEWQTRKFVPPVAKDGKVPKNERGQVDLWRPEMLPGGCVHLGNRPYVSNVCKKLNIDYAPCMVGFEVRHHRSVPKFDGVVICKEHKEFVDDAYVEYMQIRAKRREEKREKTVLDNWSKLVKGLLAREKAKKMFARSEESTEQMHNVEGEEV